ncbi:MAG: transketolase [Desulfovibrio sp.]|jgi:transketolase|nr:transketolase [Desulfovibrio sp.]
MPTSSRQCANALRILAIDAIYKANSGHPGAPLGMADMAEVLWRKHLKHNPSNPEWPDRDRFVLSNGHGSMLLYGLLHLTGYDLSMEELRNFRQWGSKTPGHPERDLCPGVEMTTGPLGQGLAAAVGMALAERMMATEFNTRERVVVDHRTYVFCGDGCLMEGVSHEACSLAGTWGLGKLIVLYDANGITIDGDIDGWYDEDVAGRFAAYHWQVLGPVDGHDAEAVSRAIDEAKADLTRPSLIICRTHIGFGSPLAGSAACHGSPLSGEQIKATRENLDWPWPPFEVPDDVRAAWDAREAGKAAEAAWQAVFSDYGRLFPEKAEAFRRHVSGNLPRDWPAIADAIVRGALASGKDMATRKASQWVLERIVPALPELMGGSADLTGSVGTAVGTSRTIDPKAGTGNHIHYGVREFGMCAIMMGLALHGGFIPYGGTFLSFSDQGRNALRLAALMGLRCIWLFSHDSIGVGEDGPTHQPVEQLAGLRAIPNLDVWRPCDLVETAVAWRRALEAENMPSVLSLSRQTLPHFLHTPEQVEEIARGGYVLLDCEGEPEIILMATGSEVHLVTEVWKRLTAMGRRARVLSLPCLERFEAQDDAYRQAILPDSVRTRLAVEAGHPDIWHKYVGLDGAVIGMTRFGASAPARVLEERFSFTVEAVLSAALDLLHGRDG